VQHNATECLCMLFADGARPWPGDVEEVSTARRDRQREGPLFVVREVSAYEIAGNGDDARVEGRPQVM